MYFARGSSEVGKSRWSMFTDASSLRAAVAALALCGLSTSVQAQTPTPTPARPTDNYDELFQRYLQEARDARGAKPKNGARGCKGVGHQASPRCQENWDS